VVEELSARDCMLGLLEGIAPAWAALLGADGRFLEARNEENTARKPCFFCRWSDIFLQPTVGHSTDGIQHTYYLCSSREEGGICGV